MTESTNPLSLLPESAFNRPQSTKFAAKMSFEERCAVLALVASNVNRVIVSEAMGVDRRTVGHIVNPASSHYRNVRQEMSRMGRDEFVAKYITEEVAKRVSEVANKTIPEAEKGPSERARGKAGVHTVHPAQCGYSHRLEIKFWRVGDKPTHGQEITEKGWYYRDLDSKDDADTWFHNGEESLQTSSAALTFAESNLMD